jgi:hypothetical protein
MTPFEETCTRVPIHLSLYHLNVSKVLVDTGIGVYPDNYHSTHMAFAYIGALDAEQN